MSVGSDERDARIEPYGMRRNDHGYVSEAFIQRCVWHHEEVALKDCVRAEREITRHVLYRKAPADRDNEAGALLVDEVDRGPGSGANLRREAGEVADGLSCGAIEGIVGPERA